LPDRVHSLAQAVACLTARMSMALTLECVSDRSTRSDTGPGPDHVEMPTRTHLETGDLVTTGEVLGVLRGSLGGSTHTVLVVLADEDAGEVPQLGLSGASALKPSSFPTDPTDPIRTRIHSPCCTLRRLGPGWKHRHRKEQRSSPSSSSTSERERHRRRRGPEAVSDH
jgi:hypothetical protein